MIKKIYNYTLTRKYFEMNLYTLICIFMALPISILGYIGDGDKNFVYAQFFLLAIQILCGIIGYLIQNKRL